MASPGESQMLDGISRAFFAALDRDLGAIEICVWSALGLAAAFVIVRWVRGDAETERRERRELEQRRERVASEAPPRLERREWLRVNAKVRVRVSDADAPADAELVDTRDVGAGGLSFFTDRAVRRGHRLGFAIDLGERRPVTVRGTVVRVAPPRHPGERALVGVRFGEMAPSSRERLVRWVVRETRREIIEARRGKLCACCERPLAEGALDMHPTCAARSASRPEIKRAA